MGSTRSTSVEGTAEVKGVAGTGGSITFGGAEYNNYSSLIIMLMIKSSND